MTTKSDTFHVRSYYRYCSTRQKAPSNLDPKDIIIYLTTHPNVPKKIRKEIRICDFKENHKQFGVDQSIFKNEDEDETDQEAMEEDSLEPPTKKKKGSASKSETQPEE